MITQPSSVAFFLDCLLILLGGGLTLFIPIRTDGDRLVLQVIGLYSLCLALDIGLLPFVIWDRARSDNAFLGLIALGLLLAFLAATIALQLSRHSRPARLVRLAWLLAAGGTALQALVASFGIRGTAGVVLTVLTSIPVAVLLIGGILAALAIPFTLQAYLQGRAPLATRLWRLAPAVAAGIIAAIVVIVQGPGDWQTGSGQFGLDVVGVTAAMGALAASAARLVDGSHHLRPIGHDEVR